MFVIEFGSTKRGDADWTSDRDVLLLGDRWIEIEQNKIRFKALGYNVSCFSIGCATYLLRQGSLFFKHVIDEGSLISGCEPDYRALMSKWKRPNSYDREIRSTTDLLELLLFTPRCNRGLTIAVDILVNALRSILIRRLAEEGRYIFSWRRILAESSELGFFPSKAQRPILAARMIKNQYRQSGQTNAELQLIESLTEVLRAASGCAECTPRMQFTDRRASTRLTERFPDHSYKQLRSFEFLCAQYPRDPGLAQFEASIKEPNYFCGATRRNIDVPNFAY